MPPGRSSETTVDLDDLADRLLESDPLGDFLAGDSGRDHYPPEILAVSKELTKRAGEIGYNELLGKMEDIGETDWAMLYVPHHGGDAIKGKTYVGGLYWYWLYDKESGQYGFSTRPQDLSVEEATDPLGDFLSDEEPNLWNPDNDLPSWARKGRKVHLRRPYIGGENRRYTWGIITNELGSERVAVHPITDDGHEYYSDEVDFDIGELRPSTADPSEDEDAEQHHQRYVKQYGWSNDPISDED
jgi:hypothetical protein